MIFLPPPPGFTVLASLDRCDGTRVVEGSSIPCAPGCRAHYDSNRYDDFNDDAPQPGPEPWAPFPNEALAAPHLLAQTTRVSSDRTLYAEVAIYTTTLFYDRGLQPARHWLVAVTEGDVRGHLVCAFVTEHEARLWAEACIADDDTNSTGSDRG